MFLEAETADTWWKTNGNGLRDKRLLSLGIQGTNILYTGTYNRKLYKSLDQGDNWFDVNENLPTDLYQIFTTTQALFSDRTIITITPISDTFCRLLDTNNPCVQCLDANTVDPNLPLTQPCYGDFSSIYNTGSQTFIYTVSDFNGNPLTGGTKIKASVTDGLLHGDTDKTIPDTLEGYTVYTLIWENDITDTGQSETGDMAATLSIKVTSDDNGDETLDLSRRLVAPLKITPEGTTNYDPSSDVNFKGTGGSGIPAHYSWLDTLGGTACGVEYYTVYQPVDKEFTVYLTDNVTKKTVEAKGKPKT